MNKQNTWIKRKLLTYEFKGRPRRALLWRKSIYEEWFYCARHALQKGNVLPEEFEDVLSFDDFEEWWRHPDKGFELFCEPFIESYASVQDSYGDLIDDELMLKVHINGDPDLILRDIKLALKPHIESKIYKSKAKFQPSREMKYLKRKSIALSRKVWELSELGYKQSDIADELNLMNGDTIESMETAIRKVQRAKARYISSLNNVSIGVFP